MSKELFERRKIEFMDFITREERMPMVWEVRFSDNQDMRLWFDKVSKLKEFNEYVNQVNNILNEYGLKILSSKEKEVEFLNCIDKFRRVPFYGEVYFSDNSEMYSWYMCYKKSNVDFETMVHNNLVEYQEFDLASIWSDIREEFISVIKSIKEIPNHGEVYIGNGIDVRVVYDKLKSFSPKFTEELLLYLQSYNIGGLSIYDRIKELKDIVSKLGYIPFFQEVRFSDGTDMFTWYNRYKNKIPNLEKDIESSIPTKKVNLYIIPNFKNKGDNVYTICSNEGERFDLSKFYSCDELNRIYKSLVVRGEFVLDKDKEIDSINYVKKRKK